MDAEIIQFIPRANPGRDAKALELRNVAIVVSPSARCIPDDPSEYAMDDHDAPYCAPDQDGA